MSGVVGSDCFCTFKIIIDFLSIEDIENGFSSRMHKVLINVIHTVVYEDIPYTPGLVVFKLLFLLYQVLEYFVVILRLFIFMFEEECENNCAGLSPIDNL